ncbi:hypothetical protein IVB14_12960 [Bradyrhizobium sp. 180]|uniref:hypothetical protein n=1 Tax=Bradyrhizobium sp. 180 TaxID=2782650 RepID=UPI001FF8FA87|nr:hypothetical protein [Bradyrhizobium sp. 180]MCK1491301.1 hypothetical protein [Bradyrhizobium sp. 180]
MAAAPKTKRQPQQADQTATTAPIGKSDIKRSALEAWRKLDTVIQNELALIMKGEREITASTAAAVIKFIEASASLASGPDDLSPKDQEDRNRAFMEKIGNRPFPAFEPDEYDNNEAQWAINKQ